MQVITLNSSNSNYKILYKKPIIYESILTFLGIINIQSQGIAKVFGFVNSRRPASPHSLP